MKFSIKFFLSKSEQFVGNSTLFTIARVLEDLISCAVKKEATECTVVAK